MHKNWKENQQFQQVPMICTAYRVAGKKKTLPRCTLSRKSLSVVEVSCLENKANFSEIYKMNVLFKIYDSLWWQKKTQKTMR